MQKAHQSRTPGRHTYPPLQPPHLRPPPPPPPRNIMQRLSVGSAGGKPHLLEGGVAAGEEKAGKAGRSAPDRSIHIIPVLTLLCFLVLFLLSHDPASSSLAIATDSPVLAAARTLEATAETTASIGRSGGVHRRLEQEPRLARGRRMGMALRRRRW